MKFQALNTFKTETLSKHTNDRLITPKKVIELRWIAGEGDTAKWCQIYAEPGTNWKELARKARILRNAFKAHLAQVG